jgi:putative transposase
MIQIRQMAYNFRIYPSDAQKIFFAKHFGCCRFIYNELLSYRSGEYKKHGKKISIYTAKRRISALKKMPEYEWLKEVNSQSLQECAFDLERAYQGFFQKRSGYPRYKKKSSRQSFAIPQNFRVKKSKRENCFLYVPKLKSAIKIIAHRGMEGLAKRVTIVKTAAGNYYANIICIKEIEVPDQKAGKAIGVDVGLKHLLTTSYGNKVDPIKALVCHEDKLKKLYRNLSRKKKGSKNRNKSRILVARLHEKIANIRKDFLHKLSRILVDKNQIIRIEDLNIVGLLKNRRLAKAISDASWGRFFVMLAYKAVWAGKKIEKVGRFVPTSKLCSNCGTKNKELTLKDRVWICSVCGKTHDRDVNAAKNIKNLGQVVPEVTPVERTTACFSNWKNKVGSMKQEADLKCEA